MAKRDVYHGVVRHALETDGWIITADPLTLKYGAQSVYVDLGAQAPIAAEKEGRKIAVETKSFLTTAPIVEMEKALGQFVLYRFLLKRQRTDYTLYLALPEAAYRSLFEIVDGIALIGELDLRLIVFDQQMEKIVRWIEPPNTGILSSD
jgi:hypothetical protein